jgi:co-chaperonin GroES (HSP10)
VLFERVKNKPKTIADIYIQEKNDPRRGRVVYLSRPNKSYLYNQEHDDIDIQVGDICVFSHNYEVMLEHPTYSEFDGGNGHKYKRNQRKMIMMAYRGDEIVLPKDKVIVRQKADQLRTSAGLELLKKHEKNKEGFVLESTYSEANKGDEVLYPTGSGVVIECKGEKVRLLDKNHLLAKVL